VVVTADVFEDWTGDALFFEYTQAADPIGSGHTTRVPIVSFPASLHEPATHLATAVIPLDLSDELGIVGPATAPGLTASFVHVLEGEQIETQPAATSELYYVLRGSGSSQVNDEQIRWQRGDVFVLPAGSRSTHRATTDAAFYWVTDEPMLRYLGVIPGHPRFKPTMFTAGCNELELQQVAAQAGADTRSRISVLLAGRSQPQTLTITHVLWAMYGLLPVDAVQRPHRHQSVALDLIIDCQPGCYTLVGAEIDREGTIIEPTRVDWESGGAFVTPPGLWHAHVNESGAPARLLPVQDAGLHTYLRSLDIRFVGM